MEVAAALVSGQCEAARSLEIAKARANLYAALYALLGVLLPGAIAAGPISTTACQKCSEPVAAAFLVKAGTKYADRIIDGVSAKRQSEEASPKGDRDCRGSHHGGARRRGRLLPEPRSSRVPRLRSHGDYATGHRHLVAGGIIV